MCTVFEATNVGDLSSVKSTTSLLSRASYWVTGQGLAGISRGGGIWHSGPMEISITHSVRITGTC